MANVFPADRLLKFTPKFVTGELSTRTSPYVSHRGKGYTWRRFPEAEVVLPSDEEEKGEHLPTPLFHTSVPAL